MGAQPAAIYFLNMWVSLSGASRSQPFLMLVFKVNLQFMWQKNITVLEFIETLDYQKDTLAFLSDNDELFVSNRNYKAAPNM